MKWQGDGLQKEHPPWIDNNPTMYSVVGYILLVMKTTWETTVEFGSIKVFSSYLWTFSLWNIWLVMNWAVCREKTKKASFPCFISDLQYFLKKSFLTGLLVQLYAFVDLRCSIETCQAIEQSSGLCWTRGALRWPQRWQSGPLRRSLPGWHPGWPPSPPCLSAGPGPAQQPGIRKGEREGVIRGEKHWNLTHETLPIM